VSNVAALHARSVGAIKNAITSLDPDNLACVPTPVSKVIVSLFEFQLFFYFVLLEMPFAMALSALVREYGRHHSGGCKSDQKAST
jgi:hypothetical protein